MAGRNMTEPYDPALNKLSVNQDQATKAIWEAIGLVKKAADSDDKLEPLEILTIAMAEGPGAFEKIVQIIKDEVPLEEDIINIAWGVQNQMKPFRNVPE